MYYIIFILLQTQFATIKDKVQREGCVPLLARGSGVLPWKFLKKNLLKWWFLGMFTIIIK